MIDHGDCACLRAGEPFVGKQGFTYAPAISAETVGAKGIHLQMLTIPPGARAKQTDGGCNGCLAHATLAGDHEQLALEYRMHSRGSVADTRGRRAEDGTRRGAGTYNRADERSGSQRQRRW